MKFAVLVFFALFVHANARMSCIWVRGFITCKKSPVQHKYIAIQAFDEDATFWPLSLLDKADLMGHTYTDRDGYFELNGCASDPDWLLITNTIEPFLHVKHHCNGLIEEELNIPVFAIFQPDIYRVNITLDRGNIMLDPNAPTPSPLPDVDKRP